MPSAPKLCTHSWALNLQLAFYCQFVSFGWKLPNLSTSHMVNHRLVTILYGEQPRYPLLSATSHRPAHCLSNGLSNRFLLDSSLAAVLEQLFLLLGCWAASTTARSASLVISIANEILAYVVLATSQGDPPAVGVWTENPVQFRSRPIHIPDWLLFDRPIPDPHSSTCEC
jgi:hypothetical protein